MLFAKIPRRTSPITGNPDVPASSGAAAIRSVRSGAIAPISSQRSVIDHSVESSVKERGVTDRVDLRIGRRDSHRRSRGTSQEIAKQSLDRRHRAERVVGNAQCQKGCFEICELLHEALKFLLRNRERRAPVSVLKTRPATAARKRDTARRVFHPAQPRGRHVTEEHGKRRHCPVPFNFHRESLPSGVVAPVRILLPIVKKTRLIAVFDVIPGHAKGHALYRMSRGPRRISNIGNPSLSMQRNTVLEKGLHQGSYTKRRDSGIEPHGRYAARCLRYR
jgi:hypothetical protein